MQLIDWMCQNKGLESVLKKLAISHRRRRAVCLRVRLHLPAFMSRGFVFVRGGAGEGLTVQGGGSGGRGERIMTPPPVHSEGFPAVESTEKQEPGTPPSSPPPPPPLLLLPPGRLAGVFLFFFPHHMVSLERIFSYFYTKILITLDQIVMCKDRRAGKKTLPLALLCQHIVGICDIQGVFILLIFQMCS